MSDHLLPVSPQSLCRLLGALHSPPHPTSSVAEGCKKLAACFKLFRDGCKSAYVAFCWLDALPRQTDLQLIHIARKDDADFWKRPLILQGQTRLGGDTPPLTNPALRASEEKWSACVYVCAYLCMHSHTCVILDTQYDVSQAPSRSMPHSFVFLFLYSPVNRCSFEIMSMTSICHWRVCGAHVICSLPGRWDVHC